MDQDGVIQLSRKKLASRKGMEEIAKACLLYTSKVALAPPTDMFCTRELSTYTSTSSAMVNTRYSELTTYSLSLIHI